MQPPVFHKLAWLGLAGTMALLHACAGPPPAASGLPPTTDTQEHRYEAEPISRVLVEENVRVPDAQVPFFAGREINRLRPEATIVVQGSHGVRAKGEATRYRHDALLALFDARGKRLTDFEFSHLLGIGAGHLAYSTPQSFDERWPEDVAVTYSGLERYMVLQVGEDERKIGILSRSGQRLTPPRYLYLQAFAPNKIWAVRADSCAPYRMASMDWDITYQLTYGLIDSLGREIIPFGPGPLSMADEADLLRRRDAPPHRPTSSATGQPRYPAGSTVRYYRLNGQPAFAGAFHDAASFWQGRAIVRVGQQYGIIDTLGRWIAPLAAQDLRTLPRAAAQTQRDRLTDPLRLFDPLDATRPRWWQR